MKKEEKSFKEKMKEIDKKIEDFEFDEEKNKKIKENVKKEVKEYADDITNMDVGFYDDKPFIQKLVFYLVGISNFLVGYSLYFLFKDDKKKKWQASCLSKGATIGLVLTIIAIVFEIIATFIEEATMLN